MGCVRVLTAAVLLCIGVGTAFGQVGSTAQIGGTIRDTSGGVLPGVDVVAVHIETGARRSAVTNEAGAYVLTNLPVGPYRLEASLSGFRAFQRTGIVLQVNASPVIDIALALGDLSETVSVEAAAPLIETRRPSIGAVIENERIEELPLNGRQATDLIVLAGAAVQTDSASTRAMQGGVGIAVAGGQSFGVAYMLDGAMHNNPYDNLNLPLPFPDAMQEFRVETSSTTANNGMHSGASVNAVTKSGTNLMHGDLFEFWRNHRFNATDPFNEIDPATGERVGDGLNRNQFGGTAGGPIRADRVFYFFGYQGTQFRNTPSDLEAFVPTAAMLAGDFTAVASAACGRSIPLGAPFVGNRVDPARLSPAALALTAKLPRTTDPCGRVQYSRTRPIDESQYIGKVDVQLNPSHNLFARYMLTTVDITPPMALDPENVLVSTQGGQQQAGHSLTIGDTQVLSNTTVNSLRVAANYTDVHRLHHPLGFSAPDLGVKAFSYLDDYMLLSVTGGFSVGSGVQNEARFNTPSYQITDDLTMVRGNHQFGIGGSLAFWRSLSRANVRSPGTYAFNGSITGLGLADFLTGQMFSYIQAVPNTLDMEQWYVGVYAQDTWRASPNLTLNYGLRWEPAIAQQIRNGAIYNFDAGRFLRNERTTVFSQAPPGFLYPGDPAFVNGKAGMHDHWNQWSPRVGVSWDPTGSGRTVVRGGYALAYSFINAQFHLNTSVAQPWGAEIRLPPSDFDDPFAGTGIENFFPFVLGRDSPFALFGPYIAIPPDIQTPRQQSWNATFERQIGERLGVSATYVGTYGDRNWNVRSLNQGVFMGNGRCTLMTETGPRSFANCTTPATLNYRRRLTSQNFAAGKFLGAVDEHTALGEQRYSGLLLSVRRRTAAGVTVNANYTLSKCEGHPTQGGSTPNINSGYVDPDNIDYDYGACASDRRHLFNLTAGYSTPEFTNPVARVLASNWRVTGIYQLRSGTPLVATVTGDPAGTGVNGQRATLAGDPYGDRDSITRYLNINSFSRPANGTLGDQRRGSFYGPGSRNVDIAISRTFRLMDAHRIEARVESFNFFNWTRYGNPGTNLNAPNTFGRINNAADPRIMQFALKYSF